MSRTVQDPEGRILAVDIDTGVNEITSKQIGSTLYESELSVIARKTLGRMIHRRFCSVHANGS